MNAVFTLAAKELRDGLRNRWIAAAILVLTALALIIALLGSAPSGGVKASALSVTVASLASLTVYLLPLLALLLATDAVVGESERGTLLLMLAYPVSRWSIILGKFLGHIAIIAMALIVGYGGTGLVIALLHPSDAGDLAALLLLLSSSLLLGGVFLALGYLVSTLVSERATAVGLAIGLWLLLVVLYDLGLLAALTADEGQTIGQGLFAALLLLNPTDAFRLFNLTSLETVALAAGMLEAKSALNLGAPLALASMLAWLVWPLAATVLVFTRREL